MGLPRMEETRLCRACAEHGEIRALCYRCGRRATMTPDELDAVFPGAKDHPYVRSGVGVALAFHSDAGCPQCGTPEDFPRMRYHNFILVPETDVSA